jgi:uncharacterized protein YgiB involved in biofilm formation
MFQLIEDAWSLLALASCQVATIWLPLIASFVMGELVAKGKI